MSKYYLQLPSSAGDRLTVNISGISASDEANSADLRVHLTSIDPNTLQPRYASTLDLEGARRLYTHLRSIVAIRDGSVGRVGRIMEVKGEAVSQEFLQAIQGDMEAIETIVTSNLEVVKEVLEHRLDKSEVVGLAHRKQQLQRFERLFSDEEYFNSRTPDRDGKRPESVWQSFFEENSWIFGNGLMMVYASQLDNKKLEQVTTGSSIAGAGKRVDGLLKTKGYVSSLCFVEIKHHRTELTHSKPYRSAVWRPSDELAGAVAQIQKTVEMAGHSIGRKWEPTMENGFLSGERLFSFRPRAFVVAGTLSEFLNEADEVNVERFASFELFRRSINDVEILTLDELHAKTRLMVGSPDVTAASELLHQPHQIKQHDGSEECGDEGAEEVVAGESDNA